MKITTRISASGFIELKVDEIETTIFKTDVDEAKQTISNLIDVINDLSDIANLDIYFKIKDNEPT